MNRKENILNMLVVLCVSVLVMFMGTSRVYAAEGIHVDYHSQEEIKSMYQRLNPQPEAVRYEVKPVSKVPYSLGKIQSNSLQNALNTLNFIRYTAGISYDVQISEDYQNTAQAASLVNCANDVMTHYPSQPSGMDEMLFSLGSQGACCSNLGFGYSNLYSAIVDGWMEDGDSGNIDRVGHRRWCLNPKMKYTGFGFAGLYSSMYVFDEADYYAQHYGVAWPAQNMPYEFFGCEYPWSISMDRILDASSIRVSLVRKNDGRKWTFSSSSRDGAFYVNNDGYGVPGCIIFRPSNINGYKPGDSFKVSVVGDDLKVSYDVNFFQIHKHYGGSATCEDRARCSICGESYGKYGDHDWYYYEREGYEGHWKDCEECMDFSYEDCTFRKGVCTKCGAFKKLRKPKIEKAVSTAYNSIKVSWKKVPNATKYTLYYKGGKIKKWKAVKKGIKGTVYTHISSKACPLTVGTKYVYAVKAVNAGTASELSKGSAKVSPKLSKVSITKITKSSKGMKVIWKAVNGATGYQIQRYQGGKWVQAGTTKKEFYMDKKAVRKGTYRYRVRACRGKTYSSWSAVKTKKR